MALCAAHTLGLPLDKLAAILPTFRGVRRRLEVRAEANGITLVDDFGHHPSALRESIAALRGKYPGRRLWALFEPRSNTTRRGIFQNELAQSLSAADGVYVTEIARKEQIDPTMRLDPKKISDDIRKAGRESFYLPGPEEILKADASGSRFTLHGLEFHLQLAGRHNVHNASMALCAAHTLGLPLDKLAAILPTFRGVRRRLEVRAEANGITLVDDFGHHPSALRESIAALRAKYPGRRLWALFEPRSNTTRRGIFQNELAQSLSAADGVYITEIARKEQIDPQMRLDPKKIADDIRKAGRESFYLPGPEEILKDILPRLKSGDVVAVFTNGSFGGLVGKLATALQKKN